MWVSVGRAEVRRATPRSLPFFSASVSLVPSLWLSTSKNHILRDSGLQIAFYVCPLALTLYLKTANTPLPGWKIHSFWHILSLLKVRAIVKSFTLLICPLVPAVLPFSPSASLLPSFQISQLFRHHHFCQYRNYSSPHLDWKPGWQ